MPAEQTVRALCITSAFAGWRRSLRLVLDARIVANAHVFGAASAT